MNGGYRLRWLGPADATAVASLERCVYPRAQRTGRRLIAEDLVRAEADGRNLSAGLFCNGRMVGYSLRFLEPDRRRICAVVGIPEPAGIDLSGPGIFMADIAVHPRHRLRTGLLITRMALAGHAREDLSGLPMEAFSTEALMTFWRSRAGTLARIGLRLAGTEAFYEPDLRQTLYWLHFEPRPRVGGHRERPLRRVLNSVRPGAGGDGSLQIGILDRIEHLPLLEEHWRRLLRLTPSATVFSSMEFLATWWRQLVLDGELMIVVVLAGDDVRAIAPLQITPQRWLGREYRCLGFLGHPAEVDRPLLIAPEPSPASALIADYLMALRARWDCVVLHEQPAEHPFPAELARRLSEAGLHATLSSGPLCPRVDVSGRWEDYLKRLSRGQRKSARRHELRLRSAGDLALETVDSDDGVAAAFERYLRLEQRSWKPAAGLGVAKTSAHRAFWRTLVSRFASRSGVQFRFLTLGGHDIAGTFGLLWNGCYYSLHIVHDRDWADYSPGYVLTHLELQQAFARTDCRWVDYLGGFLANKRGWATEQRPTQTLYAHPRDLRGRGFHGYYFGVKPALKRQLSRLGMLNMALNAKSEITARWWRWR
jgi:CelD/BcsL family acetyltransferase involved in cellulose biosynthesis